MMNQDNDYEISVIISVLNNESNISCCLNSVINQNFKSYEIIIIDGGSTDKTLSIINSYSNNINYLISEADTGIYNAWNKGLKVAKGNWICFIGSDDYFHSSASLRNIISVANYPDVNYVSAKVALTRPDGTVLKVVGQPYRRKQLCNGMSFAHPGSLHHKSIFKNYGFFNEKYQITGDFEFFLRTHNFISAIYLDLVIVNMGIKGKSNNQKVKLIFEGYNALLESSSFGFYIAVKFFIISFGKLTIKEIYFILKNIYKILHF